MTTDTQLEELIERLVYAAYSWGFDLGKSGQTIESTDLMNKMFALKNELLAADKAGGEPVPGVVLQKSLGQWPPALVDDAEWHVAHRGAKRLYTRPQPAQQPLTEDEAIALCKTGPVSAPDGVVTRLPLEYRRELEDAMRLGLRLGEAAHGIWKP